MVDRIGRRESEISRMPLVLGAAVLALFLSACAAGDIPPLRPDLPDDLHQSTGEAPDFKKPPPQPPDEHVKSQGEQASEMDELETLRDTHEKSTRQAIERR